MKRDKAFVPQPGWRRSGRDWFLDWEGDEAWIDSPGTYAFIKRHYSFTRRATRWELKVVISTKKNRFAFKTDKPQRTLKATKDWGQFWIERLVKAASILK